MRSYSITHPAGVVDVPTQPGWDQVLFASLGLFTAEAASETWSVPRHRALCVGDGATVRLETTRRTPMRCLYIDAELGLTGPGVRIVRLTSLCTELLAHAVTTSPLNLESPAEQALVTLLTDQLDRRVDEETLRLPMPRDVGARAVADAIIADPADSIDAHLGAGFAQRRTVERRFRAETAMTLGQWRRRARIHAALAMLSDGSPVTHTALAVGYASASSFIAAFRSEMGQTPSNYAAT